MVLQPEQRIREFGTGVQESLLARSSSTWLLLNLVMRRDCC